MNESYENRRKELIRSMDASSSQTMFEMHKSMCSEWASALNDSLEEFSEMGSVGVSSFVQLTSQLGEFIDQKEAYFKENYGSFESASAADPTFMGAMLRSFGNAKNPKEFDAQGVEDAKDQNDYANALKAVNTGYRYGSISVEAEGVSLVWKGLESSISEAQDPEMPFAPNLVDLPIINGADFTKQKAPTKAMETAEGVRSWMTGQLDRNPEALKNAVRNYLSIQKEQGKGLTEQEVMADEQHMEAAKTLYLDQAASLVKDEEMPTPERNEEGSSVAIQDEEVSGMTFAGGGRFEFTMKDGAKMPAQIFRDIKDMDGVSKSVFSRFEAKYGSGAARKLGFLLSKED